MALFSGTKSEYTENKIKFGKLLDVTDLDEYIEEYDNIYKISKDEFEGIKNQFHFSEKIIKSAQICGANLLLTVLNSNSSTTAKVCIIDYFKNNGKSAFKYVVGKDSNTDITGDGTYYNCVIDNNSLPNNNYYNSYNIKNKLDNSTKLIGTAFADVFDLRDADINSFDSGFTINGADGNDIIKASSLNDTITGGTGENTIIYDINNFGIDTINLTKGEILNINLTNGIMLSDKPFLQGENKIDLVISTNQGKIILKNYYGKNTGATVYINGENISATPSLGIVNAKNYFEADTKIKNKYIGSALADCVDASDLSKPVNDKNKGVIVKLGCGDDIIKGSRYNDTLSGGTGSNKININLAEGKFGDDIYTLTKNECLDISITSNGIAYVDLEQLKVETVKNDVVITVYDTQNAKMGSLTFKNAAKIKLGYLRINDSIDLINSIFPGSSCAFNKNIIIKGNRITGTSLGDNVDISTKTGACTVNLASGNDLISLGSYNDTVKLGSGNDTISFDSSIGSCKKVIFLSKDEELNIADKEFAGPYEYIYDGKNVIASVNNSSKITEFIFKNAAVKDVGARVVINGTDSFGKEYYNKEINVKINSRKTFTGSWLNDKVILSNSTTDLNNAVKNSKIKLGGGYNKVEFNAVLGAGNNIINLTKGENLTISESNSDENPLHYKTTYEYSGKDVVAKTIYNTATFGVNDTISLFTFKNLGVKDLGATIKYNNDSITGAVNFQDNAQIEAKFDGKKTYSGSWLNDNVKLYGNNNGIKDSIIKLGSGYNEIEFNSKLGVGDTTINLTKGENINIKDIYTPQPNDIINAPILEYSPYNSKDIILSTSFVNDTGSSSTSNFIIKNLASKDVQKENINITYNDISIFDEYVNVYSMNGKYKGSWMNDIVTLKNDDISTSASQYNLGSGNDKIDFSEFIKRNDKFDVQTINLTKGEILNLNFSGSFANQIIAEIEGNNLVFHIYKAEEVKAYKSEIKNETNSYIRNDEIFDVSSYKMKVTRNETIKEYTLQIVEGNLKWVSDDMQAIYNYMEGDEFFYSATTKEGLTYTATYDINSAACDIFTYTGAYPIGTVTVNSDVALYRVGAETVWIWDENISKYVKKSETGSLSSSMAEEDNCEFFESFSILPDEKDWRELNTGVNKFLELITSNVLNKVGNKDKEKELGRIVLKNYTKNMFDSDVWIEGYKDENGNVVNHASLTEDILLLINSDKTKITGTYGNDSIIGLNEKTTTVITNYTVDKEGSYIFGNDKIETYNTAKTILQYTSEDKNIKKLSAADFSFDYDEINNQLLIGVDDKIITTFSAYGKDETINLENLKFIDSFNKKYQFKNYKAITNDIANIDLSKDVSNTNNIVYARNNTVITNITDSKMNDIIFGSDVTQNWTYKNGGSDKFIGGVNKDTYNILFNKNTDVGIVDINKNGILASLDDVLNIEGTSADKLMLFFDVEKSTGAIDSNLVILDKTSYSKASNFINAYINNKHSGGSIELTNYFSHEAYLDTTNPNNILIKGADESTDYDTNCGIGTGRIEIVNIVNNNVSTHFDIGTLAAKVAANAVEWLNNNGNYDSVMSVIEGGNKQDIQSLLNVYANTNSVS